MRPGEFSNMSLPVIEFNAAIMDPIISNTSGPCYEGDDFGHYMGLSYDEYHGYGLSSVFSSSSIYSIPKNYYPNYCSIFDSRYIAICDELHMCLVEP